MKPIIIDHHRIVKEYLVKLSLKQWPKRTDPFVICWYPGIDPNLSNFFEETLKTNELLNDELVLYFPNDSKELDDMCDILSEACVSFSIFDNGIESSWKR